MSDLVLPHSIVNAELACQNKKNANIERLRILAAFGIVCFHSTEGLPKTIGYIGLPVFIFFTFYFGLSDKGLKSDSSAFIPKSYILNKAKRLLLPYITWAFLFWMWGWIRLLTNNGEVIEVPITILFPLYGTSLHLWYLPFAFIGLIIAFFIKFNYRFSYKNYILPVLLFFFSIIHVIIAIDEMPIPIPQVAMVIPAAIIGSMLNGLKKREMLYLSLIIFIIILFSGIFRFLFLGKDSFLFLYFSSFLLVIICLVFPGKMDVVTEHMAPDTYGIYLIHPMVIGAINGICHLYNISVSNWITIAYFLFSYMVVLGLKKIIFPRISFLKTEWFF